MTLRRTLTPRDHARARQGEPVDGPGDDRSELLAELAGLRGELDERTAQARAELAGVRVELAQARAAILAAREALDAHGASYDSRERYELVRRAHYALSAVQWRVMPVAELAELDGSTDGEAVGTVGASAGVVPDDPK